MAFWWVNHKQTRDHEVQGGYIWSPYRNANGAFNQTYENMQHVQVGDIVFSFAHGRIGAVGRVTVAATHSPKPLEFGNVGDYWADEGWLVEVDFVEVPKELKPSEHAEVIAPLLPPRYSPIQNNGHGNQGCYLAGISDALGHLLMAMTQADELSFTTSRFVHEPEPDAEILEDLHRIEEDPELQVTQRIQLAKARVGQGLFRKRVIVLSQECHVTGVTDKRLLIASHIKAWKDSTNAERINGNNGILLSPHIDALFDDHLITFENDGMMRVHPSLPPSVLDRWSINPNQRRTAFRSEQSAFLTSHRERFLQKIS